jgi:integrase
MQTHTNSRRTNRVYKSLHKPLTYLGVERTLFYFVCVGAVGAFNLFNSLVAGLAVFIGGYAFGRWVTTSDPAFLRILAKSERYKLRYDAANHAGRPLIARHHKLPWIPNEDDWYLILAAARQEPIRNRVMLAFAYDAGLRREELCSLRSDDIDPSRRTLRIRAETTKGRRERVVPYSVSSSELLHCYLLHRRTLGQKRGPLFLSESRRNYTEPISIWSWSKVVLGLARRAHIERFSTHTLRHLCLTDLARAGWDIHEIAAFAGHRSVQTTLLYIHLSGRDLSAKLAASMSQIHARRIQMLAEMNI